MVTFDIINNDNVTVVNATILTPLSEEDDPLLTLSDNEDPALLLTNEAEPLARVLPRITAFLSLLGVICVALEASLDLQKARSRSNNQSSRRQINSNTVNHIQLCYQVALFCYSLAFLLGSAPAPSHQHIWGAYGNQATCTSQAFLFQFGMYASIGWDAVLSSTYWSMVRSNNTVPNPKRRLACWHTVVWTIALAVSVYPLTTDLYNFNYNACWIQEYPNNCHLDENQPCIRGENATWWTTMASGVAVLHLIYSIIVMIGLYCSIRKLEVQVENKRQRLSNSTAQTVATTATHASTTHSYSRKIAVQGLCYASGMTLTMLPTATMVILWNALGFWSAGLSVFAVTMTPLIGYLNFCIYLRNRTVDQCHTRYAKALRRMHGYVLDNRCWSWCCCFWGVAQEAANVPPSAVVPTKGENDNNRQHANNKPRAVSQLTCSLNGFTNTPVHSNADLDFEDEDSQEDTPPIMDWNQPRQPANVLQLPTSSELPDTNSSSTQHEHTANTNESFTDDEDPLRIVPRKDAAKASKFKIWASESSDFETWRSGAESIASSLNRSINNFKVWKSQTSDFEAWESEQEAPSHASPAPIDLDAPRQPAMLLPQPTSSSSPPNHSYQALSTSSTNGEREDPLRGQGSRGSFLPSRMKKYSSVPNLSHSPKKKDFKTWKSEASDFETWQSEQEVVPSSNQGTNPDEHNSPRQPAVPLHQQPPITPSSPQQALHSSSTNGPGKEYPLRHPAGKGSIGGFLSGMTKKYSSVPNLAHSPKKKDFKTWKSEASDFETWQSEQEVVPSSNHDDELNSSPPPRQPAMPLHQQPPTTPSSPHQALHSSSTNGPGEEYPLRHPTGKGSRGGFLPGMVKKYSSVPNLAHSPKKKDFKTWKSEASDFETWQSEREEEDVLVPTRAPSSSSKARKPKTKFQVWKSEVSDFETWQSGVDLED